MHDGSYRLITVVSNCVVDRIRQIRASSLTVDDLWKFFFILENQGLPWPFGGTELLGAGKSHTKLHALENGTLLVLL